MVDQMPRPSLEKILGDKFSDISLLLKATQPEGYDEYYNPRSPLLGKELSLGFVTEKTDMMANLMMSWSIIDLFAEGQIDFAWDWMTWYQNDWKASMSIGGMLLDKITTQEIKYSQTQELHEYEHRAQKRGILGRKK